MRIVFAGPFGLWPKGTMRSRALPLARGLARRGHQVTLIVPPWDGPANSCRRWSDAGVDIHSLSLRGVALSRLSPLLAMRMLLRALAAGPEMLHIFKPIAYSGMLGMLVRWLRPDIPLFVDLDDLDGRDGWGGRLGAAQWELWLREQQEKWALKQGDGFSVASPILRDWAIVHGVSPDKVHLLLNGWEKPSTGPLDRDEVRRRLATRHTICEAGPWILWPTGFHEIRAARFIRIASSLLERLPEAVILVAGAGRSSEENAWREWGSREARVGGRIVFLGWLSGPAWQEAIVAADVGILPQDDTPINRARCPAKIPQMLAKGLPLVLEDVGVARLFLGEGSQGRLVPAGDTERLARAAQDLWRKRQEAGASIVTLPYPLFSWDDQAEGLEYAYRQALARRPGAR